MLRLAHDELPRAASPHRNQDPFHRQRLSARSSTPNTVSSIARLLGVSRSTIYKYVPDLATGRPAVEPPTARAELEAGS
ncbi:helix-turn-helix domain-containing protein [Nonomuraea sp. NPDC049709]|uniref:helix-turn-helix domain-containing protein n=1 Tax=Nonomuraea sp. NPDC049709 TaxID=3154736 RepID=UPI003438AFC5